ncbi:SusC/RagA family TonB-linked outer membrane protein [Chitinophaga sp. SYP-B3965]|uniref:SusC/RagA family TonB-linked outer membrane protein n=1 Tax=Chitinophaga sp. SYP-B3965 TaxID=2663120 RepID=UPI001299D668|nr:SusC/RagA family TonB-linked outer membrane protein [Chitinophaga sp. SYP-B3965]MRG47388.1 SusC/RagA family TonB-linked outer membrane protein [Chitinophaga sp. SYP-B3965]
MKLTDYLKSPPGVTGPRIAWLRPGMLAFCMLLIFLQAAAHVYAQKVTLSVKNMPLTNLFREVRKQTGFAFLYNNASMQATKPVTIQVSGASLEEVMALALKGQPLTYTISNNTIILKTAPVAKEEKLVQEVTPIEVKGRVLDAKTKEPVIGATVAVKGTSIGAITDLNGDFVLKINKGDQLQISFMGYETQLQKPDKDGRFLYQLQTSQQSIKDVVITGIFSRPKQNFTGAASSFTNEDLNKVTNSNVLTALKSLDPSFQMPENINFGSDRNKLPEVVLRGGNSLVDPSQSSTSNVFNYSNAPNVPLFILDGFETSLQRINDLDINRIAKVDILKDAAATAIYGSRAANGVIVIETIRPTSGQLRVTYNANVRAETPDLSGYDLLNAREKLDLEVKTGVYNNTFNYIDEQLKYYYNQRKASVERGVNTDWLSKPLRTGVSQKHNIYMEGGANDALYGIGVTYDNWQGTMKGSSRTNIMGNTYLSYRYKNFQFRNDLTIGFTQGDNSPYGSYSQYSRLNPYWAPYDANGNPLIYLEDVRAIDGTRLSNFDRYDNLDGGVGRPVNPLYNASLNTASFSKNQTIINNFSALWQAFPWLRFSGRLAVTKQIDELNDFKPAQHTSFTAKPTFEKGSYVKNYGKQNSLEGMLTADFNKKIDRHLIFATLGLNVQETGNGIEFYEAQGFPNPRLDQIILGSRYPPGGKPFGSESKSRLAGYLANVSYSYDSRYLLDLSYRLDGSSQFGSEKRFAPFWSTGIGWNLHHETFLKDLPFINRFKLRYSLGYTGSQNFPSFLGITTSAYYVDVEYRGILGTRLMGYGNTALAWQQTYKNNIGADLTLFDRLDVTANYFIERTKGSVASISTAPSSGFSAYSENMGDVLSKGWEVNARFNIINNPKNRNNWSVFVNAFSVKNTIEKISNTIAQLNKRADTTKSTLPITRYAAGQSISSIWVVESLGIDPSTGLEIYRKKNGTLTNTYDPLDQVIIGDTRAKVEGTFGTNLEINGIGMNMFFRFRYGGQAYNQTLIDRVENVAYTYYNVDRRVYEERWMKPGDQTFFKGFTNAGGFPNDETKASSRFVQDNNELICESLSAYYRFSDQLNKRLRLQNTRITFFTGDLFRFSSIKRERGLAFPFSRSFSIQLQTTF